MSLLDTPYYVRHRARAGGGGHHRLHQLPGLASPPSPAALHFGPGWGHPYRSSAREDRLLDHRLPNMGVVYDDEREELQRGHQDVGPGDLPLPSPPTSPRSPTEAAISAYSTLTPERGAPLSAYASLPDAFDPLPSPARASREITAQELRRHQAATGLLYDLGLAPPPSSSELPGADDGDASSSLRMVDPSNPLGARVIVEEGQYVVEAPTPGVTRDRLSLEFVGSRRLELVVAPPPDARGEARRDSGSEVLETVDVPAAAGATPPAAGARVGAAPSRPRQAEALRCGVRLPADCDPPSASSTYVDGVLRVTVPRRPAGDAAVPAAVEGPLVEEAREGRRRVEAARAQLDELEASARVAEERLREALRERASALAEARTPVPIV